MSVKRKYSLKNYRHSKKLQAFKKAAKLNQIAKFRIEYLYYQHPASGDTGKYILRFNFANKAPSAEVGIPPTAFSTSSKFVEAALAVHGGMFDGDTKDVRYIYGKIADHWKKIVRSLDYIGYDSGDGTKSNRGTRAYIFHDIAVQDGRIIKLNKDGYFSLPNGDGIKTSLNAHYQEISVNEPINFLPDFELAFGTKGIIGLGVLLGSLFAEQIREMHSSLFFFELWDGKGGSGKSTLASFLLKLCGRELNQFNPNIGTLPGKARRLADTSNMPIVFNEVDNDSTNKRFHTKKWNWDEDSKDLYDGNIGDSKGVRSHDNQTRTGRFRGALWVIQNTQVTAEPPTLSRFISMYYDAKHHTQAGHYAVLRLKDLKKETVSGFLIKALRQEKQFLIDFKSHYHIHNNRLQKLGLKEQRVIHNHSQLLALIDCLPMILPIAEYRINEAKRLVDVIAHEREKILQKDHPVILEFWDNWNDLNSGELKAKRVEGAYDEYGIRQDIFVSSEDILNHSRDKNLIALSLVEYTEACSRKGIYCDIKELRKFLPLSKKPEYVESNEVVTSKITGKSKKCMVFKVN